MERVTFRKEDEQLCSACLGKVDEGVRCTHPGGANFFIICGTCVTGMGIVLGT
jgi:hypothetical protein